MGGVEFLPTKLRAGTTISVPPINYHSNHHYLVALANLDGYKVGVHDGCICNEYVSLVNRHLVYKDVPFDLSLWRMVSDRTKRFYREKLMPYTYTKVLTEIKACKRKIYIAAMKKITTVGLWSQARIKMFIKPDRYPVDVIYDKAPRAIQYRSPEFNLCFMKYIKPIEKWTYNNLTYEVVSNTRVIAKGLNQLERGKLLVEKVSYFDDPKFVLIDHSAFDSTISEHHLRSTHEKYWKLISGKEFRWCCQQQIRNVGYTKHGIRYTVNGTRMSGDADTALGNCIVNADIIYGVCFLSGISKYDFMLDGDDAVIILENDEHLESSWFGKLGFQTKIQEVNEIEKVDFCQSRPVQVDGNTMFVRNPIRAMSHYSVTRNRLPKGKLRALMAGIGLCENSVHHGVPIYSAFAKAVRHKKIYLTEELRRRMEGYKPRHAIREPSLPTRLSFAKAWDIPITDQILWEDRITAATVNLDFENDEYLSWTRQRWELSSESSSCGWWRRC